MTDEDECNWTEESVAEEIRKNWADVVSLTEPMSSLRIGRLYIEVPKDRMLEDREHAVRVGSDGVALDTVLTDPSGGRWKVKALGNLDEMLLDKGNPRLTALD